MAPAVPAACKLTVPDPQRVAATVELIAFVNEIDTTLENEGVPPQDIILQRYCALAAKTNE